MYPKNLSKFRAWTKAMEANATVGTPDYGKTDRSTGSRASPTAIQAARARRRRKRRKRKKNAS